MVKQLTVNYVAIFLINMVVLEEVKEGCGKTLIIS
jgi:hypothetical protein